MPFDGQGFSTGKYVQQLDAIIDLLGVPERWGKGSFLTPDGRYCLRGAIRTVDDTEALRPVILEVINEVTGCHYSKIESFNDDRLTDHRQILAVLMKARENVAAGRVVVAPNGAIRSPLPEFATPPSLLWRWWQTLRRTASE